MPKTSMAEQRSLRNIHDWRIPDFRFGVAEFAFPKKYQIHRYFNDSPYLSMQITVEQKATECRSRNFHTGM
jgi:hypothetical protein